MLDRCSDCIQIADIIITGDDGLANGMNKFGIPLRIEACAASSYIFNYPRVIPSYFLRCLFCLDTTVGFLR